MNTFSISRKKPVLARLSRLICSVAFLAALAARAGVVLTTLYTFGPYTNGANPEAGLVQGLDGYFYGTTENGGTNGDYGTVFRLSASGALFSLHSFSRGNDGASPNGLVQGRDGDFYGTTEIGGSDGDYGTIFRISASGALTSLYSFSGGNDGANPEAGLVQGSDGYFYGTTENGGSNGGYGTIFKISASGALTSLYSFSGGNDGANPEAGLVQGSDGYFYGTAADGGSNGGYGTVFRISASGGLTSLYSFSGGNDGANPNGLVQGSDGYFYGTTGSGGTNGNYGTAFKISASGALTSFYSFTGGLDGQNPQSVTLGNDGNFYGTTFGYAGSPTNGGGIFKITADGTFTTLYSFSAGNNSTGLASLAQGPDGSFYGTARLGGTSSNGTVFKIDAHGVFTSLYSFMGSNDGGYPQAGLTPGADGYLYGTTASGANDFGTVFKISADGALTSLHSFVGNEGSGGHARLVQGADGYFYGTTPFGGTSSNGTVFKISPSGTLTTMYSFSGGNDGGFPETGLVQGADGSFYGTTYMGGTVDAGTVFKISASGTLATLYSFNDGEDGACPEAELVQGSDGYFYGTTASRGTSNYGTIFKISTNGAFTSLYSFTGGKDGGFPAFSGLVQGSGGFLYGTTSDVTPNNPLGLGYSLGGGTIFRININGEFTTVYSFTSGNDGEFPQASLVEGRDGRFYGTTSSWYGFGGHGNIFRLTIVPEFQAVTLTNSSLKLTWSTELGGTYQLQYNSDLDSSNWADLGGAAIATNSTLSIIDSVTNGPQRFYKLLLLP
jgi:uncharacterized repeat protein (TIGR03803 family)